VAGLPTIYKRYQGQYARSLTALGLAIVAAALCYYVFTLLKTHVPVSGPELIAPANALIGEWVFDKQWTAPNGRVFAADTIIDKDAVVLLQQAGENFVRVRPAHPIEYALFWQYGVTTVLFLAMAVGIFYAVNSPKFADFLIATESELKKVSWSSKAELIGSTIVVIVTVLLLSAIIFGTDMMWTFLLKTIRVLPT